MRNITKLALLFVPLFACMPFAFAQSQRNETGTAESTVREYVKARLRWAEWKDYSRFITWPDEPGWDCWWVAKSYRMGHALESHERVEVPVTYTRSGLFCADFQFQQNSKPETVRYELVRKAGVWKVDAPVPDYPYVSEQALCKWLANVISDNKESDERRAQARHALMLLEAGLQNR